MPDNEYLILPGCDDTNRGDQALIWETVDLAKKAGYTGHYSMIATEECGRQSKTVGIDSLAYLLPHPSMHSKSGGDNRTYGLVLKIRWAISAVRDLLIAYPLSKKATRSFAAKFLSPDQKKTYEIYRNAKAAFVKGGGFLHAYEGLTDTYKIYFFLYHINLALSMGIPVYIMPNSYGPFVSKSSRKMVKKCLDKCQLVYSRESISQQVLRESCNVDSILSRDLAMYLKKDYGFNAREYLVNKGITMENGRTVGITVRPYRFPGKPNPEELYSQYKKSVCNLIYWLIDNDYRPILIEHVFSENFHERDIICINEIAETIKRNGRHIDVFSDLALNCKQMKAVYAEMDYLVGTRFHSVIFALTEKVPVIAITYGGNKGDGIMKDIGLSDYAVPIDSLIDGKLITKFKSIVENRNAVNAYIEENSERIVNDFAAIVTNLSRGKNQ